MRHSELEAWTLAIVDRVAAQQPIEDARVEVKAEWPDANKAARRIAGHANAARGDPILWIIGLDAKQGVVGAAANELANWYPQVRAHFDGVAPDLVDLNVPIGMRTVVALLFETSRAPFVVTNPQFGQTKGEIEREVPWREGTSVRSAKREDLIRLLVPRQRRPEMELISGNANVSIESGPHGWSAAWWARLEMYLAPMSSERLVVPFHRCSASIGLGMGAEGKAADTIKLSVPFESPLPRDRFFDGGSELKKLSLTMDNTASELIIDGPGTAILTITGRTPNVAEKDWPYLKLDALLESAQGDTLGTVACFFVKVRQDGTHLDYRFVDTAT